MTLDRNLIDSGATIERTLTLRELGEILKENPDLVVEVDSPDGFVKVTAFRHHGTRPCVRVTFDNGQALECSIDHHLELYNASLGVGTSGPMVTNPDKIIYKGQSWWIEAQWVSAGDHLRGDCGHAVVVTDLDGSVTSRAVSQRSETARSVLIMRVA